MATEGAKRLPTFLVCKREQLPVGDSIPFSISVYETNFLDEYYKPDKSSDFFYRVFKVSDKKKHWMQREKYASSTLQSTRTQSGFSKAFIHEKKSDRWGWQQNYIKILRENLSNNSPPYKGKPIPVFDLAVWIYRNRQWPSEPTEKDIIEIFLDEFLINDSERKEIFDTSIPENLFQEPLFQEQEVTWKDLRRIIGNPPDSKSEEGAALHFLELQEIGPAKKFRYEPAERLNIITGDNSLGKTFILETIWWALTGDWLEYPALPRKDVIKTKPRIAFSISISGGRSRDFSVGYDWDKQRWTTIKNREALPGLVI